MLLVALQVAAPALTPWRTVKLDYTAANAFMAQHYGRSHYFPTVAAEQIYNARKGICDEQGNTCSATLQNCGFALYRSPLALTNWGDLEELERVYLPELRQMLIEAFAGQTISHVVFWNPKLRGSEWTANGDTEYERTGIATLAHLDTDMLGFRGETDAIVRMVERNRIESLLEGQPAVGAKLTGRGRALADAISDGQRFAIVNAWRNVDPHSPVRTAPLAVMATRYKPRADGRPPAVVPEAAPCAERSRWYTFPQMTSDECLLFLQYDRSVLAPSDVWHCALPDVSEGEVSEEEDAPPRRSMELRAFVVFDERVPHSQDRFTGAAVPRVQRLTEEVWR